MRVVLSVFVLFCVCLVSSVEYERLKGFHLQRGQELSAQALPKDVEENFNVNWSIYQFITVSFSDFDQDETVRIRLFSEHHERIFEDIEVAKEEYEIPIAGVTPGSFTLEITGEQSGSIAHMSHINIGPPAPIKFF